MPIYSKFADNLNEVDIIIAGGGTAGCVVAGRLAAADPQLEILVIEGGENNYQKSNVVHPALFREHLIPSSQTAIFYEGKEQVELGNRAPIISTGGILGGGSSINIALYSRALARDFDSWNTPGWTSKDLTPLLKRLESYHGPGSQEVHGKTGPVQVSAGNFRGQKSEDDLVKALQAAGYHETSDLQDLHNSNGFERTMRWVSPDGKRQDAAHTYLHPLLRDDKHPNLHVLCEAKVNKVVFDDDKRACGVEYTPNPAYMIETSLTSRPKQLIKARNLVIVSAGACGTPLLLERSGVGDREVLGKAGVNIVADVPGVGHNYQDHQLIAYSYKTHLEQGETVDFLYDGRASREEAVKQNLPVLGWNACDVALKIRPTEQEVQQWSPAMQEMWQRDFAPYPDKPFMMMAMVTSFFGDNSLVGQGQFMSVAAYNPYPYSRGEIHTTGPDWQDDIAFDVGFLSDPDEFDLKTHVWAYKKQREIIHKTEMHAGEIAVSHPNWHAGSVGASSSTSHYAAEDDAVIEALIRQNIKTCWHSMGTAKLAPFEAGGVVGNDLNVYFVSGLKVVDLSIVPENVAANTNGTALVIGEKGADIILKELGLPASNNGVYHK